MSARGYYDVAVRLLVEARGALLRADELNHGEVPSHQLHNVMFFTETAIGQAEDGSDGKYESNAGRAAVQRAD